MKEKKALIRLCVVAIVYKDNKFLFLKRLPRSELWVHPCGSVRHREKITDALHREVFEEAGIKVKVIKIVNVWQGEHDGEDVFSVSYLCQAFDEKVKLSHEHQDYRWLDLSELNSVDTEFDVSKWHAYL